MTKVFGVIVAAVLLSTRNGGGMADATLPEISTDFLEVASASDVRSSIYRIATHRAGAVG